MDHAGILYIILSRYC